MGILDGEVRVGVSGSGVVIASGGVRFPCTVVHVSAMAADFLLLFAFSASTSMRSGSSYIRRACLGSVVSTDKE